MGEQEEEESFSEKKKEETLNVGEERHLFSVFCCPQSYCPQNP